METKVNLAEKLSLLDAPFQPGIVGTLNDYKLAVVKVHGEFVWHQHDDTDDFFLVLSGQPHDPAARPRRRAVGRASCSSSRAASSTARRRSTREVLLIEPEGTPNTGDAGGERTAPERRI